MQIQLDIEFNQLVKIVKTLPTAKLQQLKAAIDKETTKANNSKSQDLETLLLNGPVATQKQLDVIDNNRKAINQWRTK